MKNIKSKYITLFIFIVFSIVIQAQEKTITLDAPLTGNQNKVARDLITLAPGFEYTAETSASFTAHIDEKLICDVEYITNPTPGTERILSTSKEVGSIPGSYAVSNSGAAVYSMPINLPKGVNGLVPLLGINYNSRTANGILGKGWNLNGISYITRGSKSLIHDDTINSINFSSSDRFFMDGKRLICIDGEYGEKGSTYRTEVDNLSNIQLLNDDGLYFKVQTPGGKIFIYSHRVEESSGNVAYWALKEVHDLDSNSIEYNYINNNNELDIDNIIYSNNKVEFYYEDRVVDKNFKYVYGTEFPANKLLSKIKIHINEQLYREYGFNYTSDIYSKLYEVTLKAGDGAEINSTIIDWNEHDFAYNEQTIEDITLGTFISYGDFNNDGRSDILTHSTSDDDLRVYICKSDGTGFNSYTIPKPYGFKNAFVGDFDNDGDEDIYVDGIRYETDNSVHPPEHSKFLKMHFYEFNGNSFVEKNSKYQEYEIEISGDQNLFMLNADFNGDGRNDYISYSKDNDVFVPLDNVFSHKGGILKSTGYPDFDGMDFFCILNFNGNKKADILIINGEATKVTKIYEYSKKTGKFEEIYSKVGGNNDERFYKVGDFNGDGLSDLIPAIISTENFDIYYSTGKDFVAKQAPFNLWDDYFIENDYNILDVTDFNNDGQSDIVQYYCSSEEVYDEHDIRFFDIYLNARAYVSKGNNYFRKVTLFENDHIQHKFAGGHQQVPDDWGDDFNDVVPSVNLNYSYLPKFSYQDFNSDGNGDILRYKVNEPGIKRSSLVDGYKQNLVTTITNGLNVNTRFEYANLYNNGVYTRNSLGTFPILNIIIPMYVVKKVKLMEDGVEFAHIDYEYEDARLHKEHGFLGFASMQSYNSLTNIVTTTQFENVGELYLSRPKTVIAKIKEGNTISTTNIINNLVDITVNDGKYFQARVTEKANINHLNSTSITTNYNNYNQYNQPGEIIESYGGEFTVTKTISYDPEIENNYWLPLRIDYFTVTKNHSDDEGSFSERTVFNYDHASKPHRLSSKVIRKNTDFEVEESYTYETFGSIKTVTINDDEEQRSTEYIYTDDHKFVDTKTINNEFGKIYHYNELGQLIEEEDHIGNSIIFEYNGFGEKIKTILPEGKVITQQKIFDSGDVPGAVFYISTSVTGKGETKEYYNGKGQLLREEATGALDKIYKTDFEYYPNGKLYKQFMPYESGRSDFTEFTYDNYGRLVSKVTPQGTMTNDYGSFGSKTLTITTPEGSIQKIFDNTGQLSEVSDDGGSTSYTYNNMGLVSKIDYDEETVTFEYDDAGNKTEINEPNLGIRNFTYNAFGELINYNDAKDNNYTVEYDKFGRIKNKTCGSNSTNWVYEPESGRLQSISNSGITISYVYDESKMYLLKRVENIDGKNFETSYTYNSIGDIESTTYPGGFAIENKYDEHGFLIQINRVDGGSKIWKLEDVNDRGMVTNFSYGNGIITAIDYDANYRLSEIVTNDESIHHWGYDFDNAGNLQYRRNENRSVQENFTYDDLNRLTSYWDGTISYADNGNINNKPDIGTYNYEAGQPHAVSKITSPKTSYQPVTANISYTYFDKVNQIVDPEDNYKHELTYGPDNRRKMMRTYENDNITQTKYYSGSYEKIENPSKETKELTYISAGSGLAAVFVKDFDDSENLYYIHTDYLGSIMALTDTSGNNVEDYFYDAWGQRKDPDDWSAPDTRTDLIVDRDYTGHEHWAHFDLINMNGRVYDPQLGRFLSPDPVFQSPEYSQNFNKYSYVLNNPFKYTDPSGYNPAPIEIDINHIAAGNIGGNRFDFSAMNSRSDFYFSWADLYYNDVTNTGFNEYMQSGGQFAFDGENVQSYNVRIEAEFLGLGEYVDNNTAIRATDGGNLFVFNITAQLIESEQGMAQSGGDKGSWWSDFWNNSTIAKVIPDVIYINQGAVYNFVGGGAYTTGIALKIRGGNEGMRVYSYVSLIGKAGAHGNVGLNVGYSSYVGDARNFNFEESFGGNGTRGFDWDILFGIGGTVSPVDSSGGLLYSYDIGFGPSIGASANIGSTTYILGKWPK